MIHRNNLEKKFLKRGFLDFKWISPKNIVVSQWVRIKCMFGCEEYGRTAVCPPQVPSVSECRKFFDEFSGAVIFHFEKKVPRPEDRFAWTRKINLKLLKLEREIFLDGYEKSFLLIMDSCNFCAECSGKQEICKKPRLARPTPEAMAVDVFSTVRKIGYPIEVLSDYGQTMNRYAFLLIE
ncbi:MAG: DUF2284 domain-containing protein [Candidatus Aminicenantales bacterium]